MLRRRQVLAAAASLPMIAGQVTRGQAAKERTVRVGFQKGEPTLMAARQNQSLEKALAPQGWQVEWVEFQFGPPMLEAMRVGSIDLGGVGDGPPIFAQAAHADLVYIAANRAGLSAILLPPHSTIKTIQELKGKRIAFGRGSSAHSFLLMTLEKAGLQYGDIQPVALGPADAGAAFARGAIDAWSIWDPYAALFQSHPDVQTLTTNKEIGEQDSFYIARRAFAEANPAVTANIVETFTAVTEWGAQHRPEVAGMLSDATGLPLPAMQVAINRLPFVLLPMNQELVRNQQKVADRFRAVGIIPSNVRVADAVWHPPVKHRPS